jgi:hypothetical protein
MECVNLVSHLAPPSQSKTDLAQDHGMEDGTRFGGRKHVRI